MGVILGGAGGKWQQGTTGIYYNSGYVGIGTTTPAQPLEVYSNSPAYTMGGRIFTDSSVGFNLRIFKARGTQTAPRRARASDVITGYNGFPYYAADDVTDASVNATQANAQFQFYCTEAATSTARGTGFKLNLTPIGSITNGTTLQVYHDGTTAIYILNNIPTSAAGLPSGTIWCDTTAANVLKLA